MIGIANLSGGSGCGCGKPSGFGALAGSGCESMGGSCKTPCNSQTCPNGDCVKGKCPGGASTVCCVPRGSKEPILVASVVSCQPASGGGSYLRLNKGTAGGIKVGMVGTLSGTPLQIVAADAAGSTAFAYTDCGIVAQWSSVLVGYTGGGAGPGPGPGTSGGYNDSACTSLGGRCTDGCSSSNCTGTCVSGRCGGPSARRCCLPPGVSVPGGGYVDPNAPPPDLYNPPGEGKTEVPWLLIGGVGAVIAGFALLGLKARGK